MDEDGVMMRRHLTVEQRVELFVFCAGKGSDYLEALELLEREVGDYGAVAEVSEQVKAG